MLNIDFSTFPILTTDLLPWYVPNKIPLFNKFNFDTYSLLRTIAMVRTKFYAKYNLVRTMAFRKTKVKYQYIH